jgi:hypothetical protein
MMEKPEDIMAMKAELASERAALALVLAELAALKEGTIRNFVRGGA